MNRLFVLFVLLVTACSGRSANRIAPLESDPIEPIGVYQGKIMPQEGQGILRVVREGQEVPDVLINDESHQSIALFSGRYMEISFPSGRVYLYTMFGDLPPNIIEAYVTPGNLTVVNINDTTMMLTQLFPDSDEGQVYRFKIQVNMPVKVTELQFIALGGVGVEYQICHFAEILGTRVIGGSRDVELYHTFEPEGFSLSGYTPVELAVCSILEESGTGILPNVGLSGLTYVDSNGISRSLERDPETGLIQGTVFSSELY